jgi:myo-inositol catabolism protein IolC
MIGFDAPLYVLPFDHRGSFQKGLIGVSGELTPEQTKEIASYKGIIYDGFLSAIDLGVPQDRAAILVDEQFGSDVARDARRRGLALAMPAEKSGQDEFDFEYGDSFGAHIAGFDPTFCKVLVRYNPDGDAEMNSRQRQRLALLSHWLHERDHRFMFELLVPAEPEQLETVDNDKKRYDAEVRPALMVRTVAELQKAEIEPDVWKIEGLDKRADCEAVAQQARSGGRDHVGCIVLGRGENEAKVLEWLSTAKGVPGFIGFAVGRTTFWEAVLGVKEGQHDRETAVQMIATNYKKWVDLFIGA